jgi:hypothetical protein
VIARSREDDLPIGDQEVVGLAVADDDDPEVVAGMQRLAELRQHEIDAAELRPKSQS